MDPSKRRNVSTCLHCWSDSRDNQSLWSLFSTIAYCRWGRVLSQIANMICAYPWIAMWSISKSGVAKQEPMFKQIGNSWLHTPIILLRPKTPAKTVKHVISHNLIIYLQYDHLPCNIIGLSMACRYQTYPTTPTTYPPFLSTPGHVSTRRPPPNSSSILDTRAASGSVYLWQFPSKSTTVVRKEHYFKFHW